MRLGLISDTHDNGARTRQALDRLERAGADVLLHAGDLASGELAPLFDGWRMWLAQGNVDRSKSIEQAIQALDLDITYGAVHEIELEDARVGVVHGHDGGRLAGMINSGAFDLVVHGHTHTFRDERVGSTRVVNPGAVHRSSTPSVCTYDPGTDTLERLELET